MDKIVSDIDKAAETWEEVANKLWKNAKGRKLNAILMFSDISGSTELSTRDDKAYFLNCVHHFFRAHRTFKNVIPIVKTIGDEVMFSAVFGPSFEMDQILIKIVKQAFEFQKQLQNREIYTKVAIHLCENVISSKVIEGAINQIRDLEDLKIHPGDVFGKDVNLAARIMAVAKRGQLLISQKAFRCLPYEWQHAAKARRCVEYNIRFDLPMAFPFKGFEKLPEATYVIQLVHDQVDAPLLSEVGYSFRTLMLIDLSDWRSETIQCAHETIQTVFSQRNIVCVFKGNQSFTLCHHPYQLTYIIQTPTYDYYIALLKQLKEGERRIIKSTLTIPFWQAPDKISELMSIKSDCIDGYLVLWFCNGYSNSVELQKEISSIKSPRLVMTNLLLMGYYDNLTIFRVFKEANQRAEKRINELANSFDRKQMLRMKPEGWAGTLVSDSRFWEWDLQDV